MEIVGAGACLLVVFLSGFWLTRSGRPYGALVLSVHKLISLFALALLVAAVVQTGQAALLSSLGLVLAAITGVLFAVTIVSGGLVTIDRPMPGAILVLHRVAPFLKVISTGVMVYLVLSGARAAAG
jgi:hypothetical protein